MLQDKLDMSQRKIAEKLASSTSGLNYCLKALVNRGWVRVHNFSQNKNKSCCIYVINPQGIVEKALLASRFLKREIAASDALENEIEILDLESAIYIDLANLTK